jgi:hypothetical protein
MLWRQYNICKFSLRDARPALVALSRGHRFIASFVDAFRRANVGATAGISNCATALAAIGKCRFARKAANQIQKGKGMH